MGLLPQLTKKIIISCQNQSLILKTTDVLVGRNDVDVQRISKEQIVITMKSTNRPFYNSFLPIINVSVSEVGEKIEIAICARLRHSVQTILILYMCIAAFFELVLVAQYLFLRDISVSFLLFPAGLSLFAYLMTYVGLLLSSKRIIKCISMAINTEDFSL